MEGDEQVNVRYFFERLKRSVLRADRPLFISDPEVLRYVSCLSECYNHQHDPDWYDTPAGLDCESYVEWFEENLR